MNLEGQDSSPARHVAIIMDGNGRWAEARGMARIEGHKAGASVVREVVTNARKTGLRYLTLYTFSFENWGRPEAEVLALMQLFIEHMDSEEPLFHEHGIRFRVIGDRSRLPEGVREGIARLEGVTREYNSMDLVLAMSYGGRNEIVRAASAMAQEFAAGKLSSSEFSEQTLSSFLDTRDIPDPDLLIRTGGDSRISNFLLWQAAYAELVFTQTFWPDFGTAEFENILSRFQERERRFGLTSQQLECASGK